MALVGLLVTRLVLGRLGQHDYGLWLVATQLLAYLMLLDLGIVGLLPREVAYATGRAGMGSWGPPVPDLIGQTVRIVLWQLPLVTLAAAVLWIFLPAEWQPIRRPLGIVMLAFLATFPLRIPPATLLGLQDLAFQATLQTGALLAGTATMVVLVTLDRGLEALAIGWATTQLIAGIGAFVRLRKRFPAAIPSLIPHLTWPALRERFGRSMWVGLSQVAVVLLRATDAVIIGKVIGAAAVVPYVCTAKLMDFLANQPQLLMQIAQPGLAELRARESRARVHQAAMALTHAVLMGSGAIACGVMAVNHGFVRLWVGEAQWGGYWLTALILGRAIATHWNSTTGTAIFAFGYEKRLAIVGLADGVVFVALATLLVGRVGLVGAPLAGILSVLLVGLPWNLSALSRETETSAVHLAGSLWPWAWRFGLAFALAAVIARILRPTSPPGLLLAGTTAVAAYAALVIPRLAQPPLRAYLHPCLIAWLGRLPPLLRGPALP
jgi:O-antigen/teichoic acid export membrane protein